MLKLSVQAALVVLIIALPAVWPCLHYSPEKGITALIAAAVVCLICTFISMVPLMIAVKHHADWLARSLSGRHGYQVVINPVCRNVGLFCPQAAYDDLRPLRDGVLFGPVGLGNQGRRELYPGVLSDLIINE